MESVHLVPGGALAPGIPDNTLVRAVRNEKRITRISAWVDPATEPERNDYVPFQTFGGKGCYQFDRIGRCERFAGALHQLRQQFVYPIVQQFTLSFQCQKAEHLKFGRINIECPQAGCQLAFDEKTIDNASERWTRRGGEFVLDLR